MPVMEDISIGQTARVTAGQGALRVADYPTDCLSYVSLGAQTGNITGLAANAALFSLRNISANPVAIRKIGIGFVLTTAFTTAQMVSYGLMSVRAFTASDTAGTTIALTGNNAKVRSSLATLSSVDCRVSAAAALTAGTKTLDTNTMGQVGAWAGAVGTIINSVPDNLFNHSTGDYPIILAQNEGINIQNLTAMGAGGVGVAFINLEIAEMASFQG